MRRIYKLLFIVWVLSLIISILGLMAYPFLIGMSMFFYGAVSSMIILVLMPFFDTKNNYNQKPKQS